MADGVLVTRPEPGASETAQRLIELHRTPVLAPLLRVRPLRLVVPPRIGAVLVTSGNAIPCLPDALHAMPLLAVGDRTAERARSAGFADVASADGDAGALAALAAATCVPGAALLLATAARQGAALAGRLRALGFAVHRRAVYDARPVARLPRSASVALRGGGLSAALFFSAETARAFVRLLPPDLLPALAGVDALAIGSTAAETLSVLPWRRVLVSAKPTTNSLLALL